MDTSIVTYIDLGLAGCGLALGGWVFGRRSRTRPASGKDLLTAAANHAAKANCSRIGITVISARPELIAWYERHGYKRTGEVQPFHHGEKFGIQKQPLELVVLEKPVAIRSAMPAPD